MVFGLVERWRPARPRRGWRRPGLGTDLVYWFFTPLVTRWVSRLGLVAAVLLLALAAGVPLEKEAVEAMLQRPTWAGTWPPWVQALAVLLLADLLGYWSHRAFHTGRLWRFHAVHHSSTDVD